MDRSLRTPFAAASIFLLLSAQCNAQEAAVKVGELKAQAEPLSLDSLVHDSKDIVRGTVEKQGVLSKPLTDGVKVVQTPVYQVVLNIKEVYKGSNTPGKTMIVSQWARSAQPVKEVTISSSIFHPRVDLDLPRQLGFTVVSSRSRP